MVGLSWACLTEKSGHVDRYKKRNSGKRLQKSEEKKSGRRSDQ